MPIRFASHLQLKRTEKNLRKEIKQVDTNIRQELQKYATKEALQNFQLAVKQDFDVVKGDIRTLQVGMTEVRNGIGNLQTGMNEVLHYVKNSSSKTEHRFEKIETDVAVLKTAFQQHLKLKH